MTRLTLLAFTLASLGACKDDKDDTGGGSTTGDDTSSGETGFTITGNAFFMDGTPAMEGLCVAVADPTPAITGGELEILASSTLGASGAFSLSNVVTSSAFGLLVLIQDCAGEGTVMPTATGIAKESYENLGDGDTLSGANVYSVDATTAATFSGGLAMAGYSGDLSVDGALMGFVLDSAGAPVDAAVVAGTVYSPTVYYLGAKGFVTTGTVAAAGAMFIIPGAEIDSYTCTASGYTFTALTAGSQPGFIVLVKFDAM